MVSAPKHSQKLGTWLAILYQSDHITVRLRSGSLTETTMASRRSLTYLLLSCTLPFFQTLVEAQFRTLDIPGQNITVTFSEESASECPTKDSASGISFSTYNVPPIPICYNLATLFSSNSTSGHTVRNSTHWSYSVNQTYTLYNQDLYSSATNYSRIRYQQVNESGDIGSGEDAAIYFQVWPGIDCEQANKPNEFDLQPYYVWTCQSEAAGDCYTVPISIQSFSIGRLARRYSYVDKCFEAKELGAAGRVEAAKFGLFAAILVAMYLVV
ncbi:hypothetical protein AC578_4326 [Pseudocercospora eumusae]|uniref:Uncharacterized protein n=1 Tax=Pseudocercospora eumusae TaxID=321146 RepID=A0A139H7W2_9PEZI|nr:hypothetical protein AC578_4326 [Pseudocercospora eumusae]